MEYYADIKYKETLYSSMQRCSRCIEVNWKWQEAEFYLSYHMLSLHMTIGLNLLYL